MKVGSAISVLMMFLSAAASAQTWQDCKPDGDYSFKEIKGVVRRVMSTGLHTGWDEKAFARSGDLVAVAVLQTLDDRVMAQPEKETHVLSILRSAFGCPDYCIKSIDDRRPTVTLLLLEHLRRISSRKVRSEIDDVKAYVLKQAKPAS